MSTIKSSTTTTTAYSVEADTTGALVIQTGATPTTALTLSTSQNATFAGTVADSTGTLRPLVSGTAVASTSGTSIDFTGLPSWIKRITVMLNGVSVSGTSNLQIQLGSGSFTTSGYTATNGLINSSATNYASQTSGFFIGVTSAGADTFSGAVTISLLTSNTFVEQGCVTRTNSAATQFSSGVIALGGTLDRVRITTVNGTDTFDAGTINILYE
jgi:hypothetical protein